MEIITHPGSGIENVESKKGKNLAFTSQTSNSGFKAPSAILDMNTSFQPTSQMRFQTCILWCARQLYIMWRTKTDTRQR
ncbi:PhnD/SsuA/transferrin family substrate-binding protein [Vibrio chagasii]|nr:PhnD/SsuA/transferrin family substrate-binding protein [Vibrio chagasii]